MTLALSDMLTTIQDEISRSDLSVQVQREINNAVTFYQNERFWFNENTMITLTTIQGQREYTLPPNFTAVLDVRSQQGNLKYLLTPATIQYLDTIDWGNNLYVASYLQNYAFYNGRIRIYPAPTAGLPIFIKGTVLQPTLTTTVATKSYTKNTAYSLNDTVTDANGNIQTCVLAGTTGTAATKSYTANTAYSINDTILDGNQNIQTCTTAGTSGYVLIADKTMWGMETNGITVDGTASWTLTTKLWSTDYNSFTNDGSVVWQLTNTLSNPWMTNAEELIRTRTIEQLYLRYIHDAQNGAIYSGLVRNALQNLRGKNTGQTALNTIRAHI